MSGPMHAGAGLVEFKHADHINPGVFVGMLGSIRCLKVLNLIAEGRHPIFDSLSAPFILCSRRIHRWNMD